MVQWPLKEKTTLSRSEVSWQNIGKCVQHIQLLAMAGCCLTLADFAQADKIYTIGDSITRGTVYKFEAADYPLSAYRLENGVPDNNIRSYREHLHDLLTFDDGCGAKVEWVGSKDEQNRIPEFHEGRSGWRADEINNRRWKSDTGGDPNGIEYWLNAFEPDHVLIHLGTNDMQQGQTAEATRDDLSTLLDTIGEETPDASVFLANVIPIYGWWAEHINAPPYQLEDRAGEAAQLTGLVDQMVAERQGAGENIHLVDVNSDFFVDTSDITNCDSGKQGNPLNMSTSICKALPDGSGEEPDGIHPNIAGDKFIADKFYEALRENTSLCSASAVEKSVPLVDPTFGSVVTGNVQLVGNYVFSAGLERSSSRKNTFFDQADSGTEFRSALQKKAPLPITYITELTVNKSIFAPDVLLEATRHYQQEGSYNEFFV